jgi:hypothetical protein
VLVHRSIAVAARGLRLVVVVAAVAQVVVVAVAEVVAADEAVAVERDPHQRTSE